MCLTFSVFVCFAYEDHWFGLGLVADAVDDVINDGASAREKYLTGYLVEKSLSVDNIFVISIIFSALQCRRFLSIACCSWASSVRWSCAA